MGGFGGSGGGLADTGIITYLDGTVASAPGTPGSGKLRIYAKTGPALAVKDDGGAETVLGAGGSGIILEAHHQLISTEIKALMTKVELVPAVAGLLYVPIGCAFYYTFVTPAYTMPAGVLAIIIGTVADGPFPTFVTAGGILSMSENNIAIPMTQDVGNVAQNFLANQPLSVWFSGASNPTVGNGTLDVWVDYRIISV